MKPSNTDEFSATPPRYGVNPYLEWIAKEGLPVHEGWGLDLFAIDLGVWPRLGVKGAAAHLKGRGDFTNMFVIELPPGGSTIPQRHLYEDVYYVLEGDGSTQIELPDGAKRSFEWAPKSMFAIPLNAKHRHFNGSGKRALLVTTTNMPLIMNTYYSEKFVFDTDVAFEDRFGSANHFEGEGNLQLFRPGNHIWETNFVPDLASLELKSWSDRGGGGSNLMFVLADGLMHVHISEMPVGVYKKAHRHPAGYHVMCVKGSGFSLLWYEGEDDFIRVDWKHGVVFPPADLQFHQHFNTCQEPARYLATGTGGIRYPLTTANRQCVVGLKPGDKGAVSTSIKDGGWQVDYEDQDPRIQAMWLEETRKNGVQSRMQSFFASSEAANAT
jgi:mannose-6-phosphate isomerase-like protein (cupin superfamily)